jgi:ribosomal protein S27AE
MHPVRSIQSENSSFCEKRRNTHRVEARARASQKEKEKRPDRVSARYAVSNAVRDGRLRKMDCAFCGSSNTVAHHHDYAKPLEVTWLCNPCHTRFHALELMGKNADKPA